MEPSRDAVLAALAQVIDPELQRPVTELDMVRGIEIADGIVSLTIVLTVAGCPLRESFETQVDKALSDVPGVRGFSLSFAVFLASLDTFFLITFVLSATRHPPLSNPVCIAEQL